MHGNSFEALIFQIFFGPENSSLIIYAGHNGKQVSTIIGDVNLRRVVVVKCICRCMMDFRNLGWWFCSVTIRWLAKLASTYDSEVISWRNHLADNLNVFEEVAFYIILDKRIINGLTKFVVS